MPTPGRPRNPLGQTPTRFHEQPHVLVARPGETPGLQDIELRERQAPGTIRRVWRQMVNYIPPPPPVNWTTSPAVITRALRYRATTVHLMAGNSNTRMGAIRPIVERKISSRPVTIAAGNKQNLPTVRNRLSSFGSRVPPLNGPVRVRKASS